LKTLLVAALCLVLNLPALGQGDVLETIAPSSDPTRDDVPEPAPWVEEMSEIPALPAEADWEKVDLVELQEGFDLLLVPDQVQVGKSDGVSRLWLIMRSARGSINATFEGYRCATGDYRVYAYASPRRGTQIRRLPPSEWRPTRQRYRKEFMQSTLCNLGVARSPASIRAVMRGVDDSIFDLLSR